MALYHVHMIDFRSFSQSHLWNTFKPSCLLREALFDELVQEVAEPEEGEPLRHLDAPAFAADLFELGAKPETLYRNRSTLYEISSALEQAHQRRQKKLKRQLEGDIPGRVNAIFALFGWTLDGPVVGPSEYIFLLGDG